MQVIATQRGYFGQLREPGDTFDVPDGSKATWFEPVKAKAEPEADAPKGGKKQQKPADDLA